MLYDEYTDLSSERVPCLLPAHLASSSLQVAAVATWAVEKAAPNPSNSASLQSLQGKTGST